MGENGWEFYHCGTAILLFSIVTVSAMGKATFAIPLGLYIAI